MLNLLTIDIEDYFQVENFAQVISPSDWEGFESRVVQNTEKILEILASHNIKATFFVLGWVAQRFPQLVKEIHRQRHEIASHGYSHKPIYRQTQEIFRSDIRRAKQILEGIIREPVLGYRAPTWSITKNSIWALDILMEEGFKYDSSLFPIHRGKGGLPVGERRPYKIYNHQYYLWEFPISTARIFRQNIPFSGGGYFRLSPYGFVKSSIAAINRAGHPAIVYLHPWELDPAQPKIKVDMLSSFRHYVNLSQTERKLNQLLNDFKFTSIKNFLDNEGEDEE